MASLYEKSRSPFWYCEWVDESGRRRNESTRLRRDDPGQTRKARALCAERSAAEYATPKAASGEGWAWVEAFLDARYRGQEKTRLRMRAGWFALDTWLRMQGVRSPRMLDRAACLAFPGWRLSGEARKAGLRAARHNTALFELKALSTILREAVARGLAPVNPCLQLGLKRVRGKIKPEILPDEIAQIEAALVTETGKHAEALRISWAIAMAQGCRLGETCVRLADVDFAEQTITFRVKGGGDHTAMLNPAIAPLLRRLRQERREFAFALPPSFAKVWWTFFQRLGMPHLSFHCTRVTAVTRLRRAKVDPRVARDFIGHSSEIIHRIYERGSHAEQAGATAALGSSASSESGT